ncbi:MAG: OmpA family protein [Roseicyclus sp.]|nr:OmpA family protein [Roseicyclus sp.]
MAKRPIPLPVPLIEPDEPEEKKCPPKGAPAWMATFADIATLLMAFFVLILSFAEFDRPRFKMVSGSLRDAFGVQREVPVMEMPMGTTILSESFSPSPDPSVLEELTQETTETEDPEVETGDGGSDGVGSPGETEASEMAEAIDRALPYDSPLQAEVQDGEVVLRFPEDVSPEELAEAVADAAEAVQEAAERTGTPAEDVQIDGLAERLADLAEMLTGEGSGAPTEAEATESAAVAEGGGGADRAAALAEAELRVALRQEIAQGLVTVEQREDRVFVTVGAGGAFPSGTADLTGEAREIMSRIAFSAMDEASEITVTGHTDTVPVGRGSVFQDNWGLAAARASSVVRELQATGLLAPERLTALSRGESQPIASNATPEGRERNRRIEIEIAY